MLPLEHKVAVVAAGSVRALGARRLGVGADEHLLVEPLVLDVLERAHLPEQRLASDAEEHARVGGRRRQREHAGDDHQYRFVDEFHCCFLLFDVSGTRASRVGGRYAT